MAGVQLTQGVCFASQEAWSAFLERLEKRPEEPIAKRSQHRFAVPGGAVVLHFFARSVSHVSRGLLLQVSHRGLMFKSATRVPINVSAIVEATCAGHSIACVGRIVHCTNTVAGFKVGLLLEFNR